jgi:S1-C subfamily serine protease
MKKYRWLFAVLGVMALGIALVFGAALGAGITYFFLQAEPVQAAFAAPVEVDAGEGVLVSAVEPGSAAAETGLVRGDIILAVDGETVNDLFELQAVLAETAPGDTAELTVLHGDETRTLSAVLDARNDLAYLGVNTCGGPMMFDGPMGDVMLQAFLPGAEVTEVIADSPAEAAGLQVGDVVVRVDGEPLGPEAGLADLIQAHEPGDKVTLEVQSPDVDEIHRVEVTLGEHPDDAEKAYLGVAYQAGMGHFEGGEFPFMEMLPFGELPEGFKGGPPQDLEEGEGFYFHKGEGMPHFFDLSELPEDFDGAVIISEVLADTPAEDAGLQPGDLILAVDGKPVAEIETFVEALQSRQPGDEVALTIFRNGDELEVETTLTAHPDDPDKGFLGVLAGSFTIEEVEFPEGFDQDFEFELPGAAGGDA